MTTHTLLRSSFFSLLLLAGAAGAQTSLVEMQPQQAVRESWESSVLTGRTVGAGRFVVHGEVGYPGLSVGLIWGQGRAFDAGFRVSAGYGSRMGFGFAPGFGGQAVLRWSFLNQGLFSLGARFEPGAFVSPGSSGPLLLAAPAGLSLGLHPHPIVNVALGLDTGVGLVFTDRGGVAFAVPLEVGPGVEVNLTDALALTLDTRFGVGWWEPFGPWRGFGLKAALGLAFRM